MKRRILAAIAIIAAATFNPVAPVAEAHTSIATLSIPRIGLRKPVVAGRQAAIDAGYVVAWNGCLPGNGCTVYLLGHRTTHGSVFAKVPYLAVGDTFDVYTSHSHRYRIVRRRTVPRTIGFGAIYGPAVIQTSMGGGYVLLLYANRI